MGNSFEYGLNVILIVKTLSHLCLSEWMVFFISAVPNLIHIKLSEKGITQSPIHNPLQSPVTICVCHLPPFAATLSLKQTDKMT